MWCSEEAQSQLGSFSGAGSYAKDFWKSGRGAKSGVFVFERTGGHNATVVLDLEGSPERIAVDATGQFYVLSLDAAWVEGGLVYHVLPQSRVVRVFDTGGALVREIALAPPDGTDLLAPPGLRADPASNQVARILRLRDGRWLIEWIHMERSPGRGRRTTFLSLHGEDGRPLSQAAHPPSRPSIPVGTDAGGRCVLPQPEAERGRAGGGGTDLGGGGASVGQGRQAAGTDPVRRGAAQRDTSRRTRCRRRDRLCQVWSPTPAGTLSSTSPALPLGQ